VCMRFASTGRVAIKTGEPTRLQRVQPLRNKVWTRPYFACTSPLSFPVRHHTNMLKLS